MACPEKFELPAPRFEVKVDCVAQGISGPVTKEAALRAAAWCEYLDANARRYYGLLKDDELRAAQALAIKLERGALEDGFTLRDVRRNQWRSLTTDEAGLDWLEDEDWLRSEATGGTGPGSGRLAILYGGSIFACRNCYQLGCASSHEDAGGRATRRADRLRTQLGWEPGILNGEGDKPKWMRWRTFERLAAEHNAFVDESMARMALRFGIKF